MLWESDAERDGDVEGDAVSVFVGERVMVLVTEPEGHGTAPRATGRGRDGCRGTWRSARAL